MRLRKVLDEHVRQCKCKGGCDDQKYALYECADIRIGIVTGCGGHSVFPDGSLQLQTETTALGKQLDSFVHFDLADKGGIESALANGPQLHSFLQVFVRQ
jgi:uncharacterized FAD-dependent dehydrogenase